MARDDGRPGHPDRPAAPAVHRPARARVPPARRSDRPPTIEERSETRGRRPDSGPEFDAARDPGPLRWVGACLGGQVEPVASSSRLANTTATSPHAQLVASVPTSSSPCASNANPSSARSDRIGVFSGDRRATTRCEPSARATAIADRSSSRAEPAALPRVGDDERQLRSRRACDPRQPADADDAPCPSRAGPRRRARSRGRSR